MGNNFVTSVVNTPLINKKQFSFENKNIQVINDLTQKKLNTYQKNCFFSTYGLFCLLDVLKNGTTATSEIHKSLANLIDDHSVHNIATTLVGYSATDITNTNDVFKNISLIFHDANLVLSNKFAEYLKSNNIISSGVALNKLQQTISEINQQLGKMTNDKIKDPLSPGEFDQNFIMLLANVLYFCDDWVYQFEREFTKQILFKNGKNKKVDMMCMNEEDYSYYENGYCQYISLPYKNYQYKMVVALPKGISENKKYYINNLDEVLQNMTMRTVTKLMLPKFKIEQEENLNDECINLGLGKIFINNNDFDTMFENSTVAKCIKKIKQKTFINVDEDGTEAASITIADLQCQSCRFRPKSNGVEFIADHPFSFFILGPNNIVLFAGKFYNY
jgi:serine protease inhibitor